MTALKSAETIEAPPKPSPARARVREFLFLEEAERKSSSLSATQLATVRSYFDAALRRLRTAQELRLQRDIGGSLALYRQADLFLALAYLVSKDASIDPTELDEQTTVDMLRHRCAAENVTLPASFGRIAELLVSTDPFALDRLPAREARRSIEDLEAVGAWLGKRIDPRSPEEVKVKRRLRITFAIVALLAIVGGALAWLLSPKNLALHKHATSSSQGYETTPDGAVDGHRYGQLGFHSSFEDSPWLAIDLGARYEINKLKIYGRGECCFDQSVPLALEVSDDGTTYRKVDQRTEQFSQFDPWIVKPQNVVARFVRLRTERRSVLVTSEVEVYGRAAK